MTQVTMVALAKEDGSVDILQLPKADATASEIAHEIAKQRRRDVNGFTVVSPESLPDREHREAWVFRNGKVEIDPSRIRRREPAPRAKEVQQVAAFDPSPLVAELNALKERLAAADARHARQEQAMQLVVQLGEETLARLGQAESHIEKHDRTFHSIATEMAKEKVEKVA